MIAEHFDTLTTMYGCVAHLYYGNFLVPVTLFSSVGYVSTSRNVSEICTAGPVQSFPTEHSGLSHTNPLHPSTRHKTQEN